jgi:hypothetical protein
LLRPVAERQAQVGKRELELPAREMLAEMFLMSAMPGEALTLYQASLSSDPNRLNALLGAGLAAERIGNRKLAVGYYKTAIGGCSCATGPAINTLAHARSYIRG